MKSDDNVNNVLAVTQLGLIRNGINILRDINFTASRGEYVSIVGPNGAGKSTLIKAVAGLIKNYSGSIAVYGSDPSEISSQLIGYVPQVKTLDRNFPAKLIELVASGVTKSWNWKLRNAYKNRAAEAIEKVGLGHLMYRNLSTLSGGELQRAYLARAIAGEPKLLLLDEPATGVDTKAESDLCLNIDEYKNNTNALILAVTHDWNAAYHHSDKVLMINAEQLCYDVPEKAFSDDNLRRLFGHIGHTHNMKFGGKHDD